MSIGMASVNFTDSDQKKGYKKTREHLADTSIDQLIRVHQDNMRHNCDSMFGHICRRWDNLVIDELLSRGVTEIPNIFGAIKLTKHIR